MERKKWTLVAALQYISLQIDEGKQFPVEIEQFPVEIQFPVA